MSQAGIPDDAATDALGAAADAAPASEALYTRSFFQVFAAVVCYMSCIALNFHFAQYVVGFRGFSVAELGWILMISQVGTLLGRFHLGQWIDWVGCKRAWLAGTTATAIAMLLMPFAAHFLAIAALRMLLMGSMALTMTTVAVFAAQVAPPHRRAESLGTIGLAGFFGMIVGPTLGDFIFSGNVDAITPYLVFFWSATGLAMLAGLIVLLLELPHRRDESEHAVAARKTPILRLVRTYWPGATLLVGATFALAFCFPQTYLERLAEQRGFQDIKLFFLTYAPTAIVLRIVFRRAPEILGRERTMVMGMGFMAIGLAAIQFVWSQWMLLLPGLLMGAGHCFVFPSMVDLAASKFPATNRGVGTSLILGTFDLGLLLGFGGVGALIEYGSFPLAIQSAAGLMVVVAAFYVIRHRQVVLYGGAFRPTESAPSAATSKSMASSQAAGAEPETVSGACES